MKKDKKYWKKLAKHWSNQLELMESKYWEAEYTISILEDQLNVLRNQGEGQAIALEATKRELSYFRQRNIGKKVDLKGVFMPDDYFGQLDRPAHPYTKENEYRYSSPDLTSNHEKNQRLLESNNTTTTNNRFKFRWRNQNK
jgi:hypothetical protein